MKQTAVDWLFQELWDRPKDKMVWQILLREAKQREKEQIEIAYHQAVVNEISIYSPPDAEQYYKETYE